MSKVIRVSDDAYTRLKNLAEPFVDSPSDVVERLLDFHEQSNRSLDTMRSEAFRESDPERKGDSIINSEIVSFVFLGKEYSPNHAYELLQTVATQLYERHSDSYEKCLSLRGNKRRYVSRDPDDLVRPKKVKGSPYYVMTKLDKDNIVKVARKLMGEFGYDASDLEVVTN
jgi:negative regulator of replication initiation